MYELPIPDEYVDNVPDDDDLPALSYGVHRLRRIQIPGDIPGLPRLLDRATAASAPALAATAHVSIRTVRSVMKELRGHGLGPTNPQGWRSGVDEVSTASHHANGTRGRLRRIVSSWRAERGPGEQSLVSPMHIFKSTYQLARHTRPPTRPPTAPPTTWTRFGVFVAISRARCLGRG